MKHMTNQDSLSGISQVKSSATTVRIDTRIMRMSSLRDHIISSLQVKAEIEGAEENRIRIEHLKDYLRSTGLRGFVLGISGGQDSTLVGWLAQQAVMELRKEGQQAVFIALRLPYRVQGDEEDAQLAL